MLHNAELCIVAPMTGEQKKSMAVFPKLAKQIDKQQALITATHPGMERWGLTYIKPEDIVAAR